MFNGAIDPAWGPAFLSALASCHPQPGENVVLLSESHSRPQLIELMRVSLATLGLRYYHLQVPTPLPSAIPLRSTGSSLALDHQPAAIAALAAADLVVDCTVEGLLHTQALRSILQGGARVWMISNEHPEVLARLPPDLSLEASIGRALTWLAEGQTMRVTSAAGTDLMVNLEGAQRRGGTGCVRTPGTVGYWPGGLVACFPARHTVSGQIVLAPGDVNLTFKRYVEAAVRLVIEDDHVVAIEGQGVDAELMRSYYAAWHDPNAYAVSHVGWGMDPRARWDSLAMYDRHDINGTELRTFAGNFLYSTGANEFAGRYTQAHFDLPMRRCTVSIDGRVAVCDGQVVADLSTNSA